MIPKIIHYCWLSNDNYPQKIEYCINTWKKHLPDYSLRLWDLNRFDINSSIWCREAFDTKNMLLRLITYDVMLYIRKEVYIWIPM